MNCNDYKIGVFGKIKKPDYVIKENDRLELYEPITIDPKVRRKNIATNK
jgi:putative ubiquitin-RnfH superfamily antitoxin RatB of RatAB toxin-antitoxin module